MTRLTKKILSAVLAGAMVLTMGVSAFAADGDSKVAADLSAAGISKTLQVADGITGFPNEFTFSFEKKSSATAETADHPTIGPLKIPVGTQSNDEATGVKKFNEIFTDDMLGSATGFKHAGEYVYKVTETAPAASDQNGKKLEVDDAAYEVHVWVGNKADGSGLEYTAVTVEEIKGESTEKVDPTITKNENQHDISGFNFTNKYTEKIEDESGVLTVTKSITGNLADKTKKFSVTVKLTLPSTEKETTDADDVALATGSEGTLVKGEDGYTVTAALADGDMIKFKSLPAGTTFTVSETQQSPYKSKITGDVKTPDTGLVEGNRTDIEGKAPITAAGNTVSIENNREDVIPTGVIINNLPYMLMVAIAVAGVAYMQLKKRI